MARNSFRDPHDPRIITLACDLSDDDLASYMCMSAAAAYVGMLASVVTGLLVAALAYTLAAWPWWGLLLLCLGVALLSYVALAGTALAIAIVLNDYVQRAMDREHARRRAHGEQDERIIDAHAFNRAIRRAQQVRPHREPFPLTREPFTPYVPHVVDADPSSSSSAHD